MERIELVVALIRHVNQQIHWLGKYDEAQRHIKFVIADRLENEPTRETIGREVAWELGLDRKLDFLVSSMAQLNLEFVDVLPNQSGEKHTLASFYNVEVYRQSVLQKLRQDQRLSWLTSEEICQGKTRSGIPIDPLLLSLNERSNVIQHWESQN